MNDDGKALDDLDRPTIAHQHFEYATMTTHRDVALSGAHLVECTLRRVLCEYVLPRDRGGYRRKLLSSFDGKAQLAYVSHLIDLRMYEDLVAIKTIRNAMAHSTPVPTFDVSSIEKACTKLHAPEDPRFLAYGHMTNYPRTSAAGRYAATCAILYQRLVFAKGLLDPPTRPGVA